MAAQGAHKAQRKLARHGGVACRYSVSATERPGVAELRRLLAQTEWAQNRDIRQIRSVVQNSAVWVTVRDHGRLIAVGRALTDNACRALVDDIVVDSKYRGQGIGTLVMGALMRRLRGVEEIFLNTGPHLERFYARHGFEKFGGLTMVRKIAQSPRRGPRSPE